MNFIKEKKINNYVAIVILFLCCGYAEFYNMRGVLAAISLSGSLVFNDVLAFLFAAIIGGIIYEAITTLLFRTAMRVIPAYADLKYALRLFYSAAFLLAGVTKTLYFYFPYLFPYGETFIEFFYAAIFFALYLWYVCETYCKPYERARTVMYLGSAFLCFYGLVAVVALLSGVLA